VSRYKYNLHGLLKAAFPGHDWLWWKFASVPNGGHRWANPRELKDVIQWAGEQLGYVTKEDWYKLNRKSLSSIGCTLLEFAFTPRIEL